MLTPCITLALSTSALLTGALMRPAQEAATEQEQRQAGADLTARFAIDERLQVILWADSPQLYNPTAMDVDARGRLWVTEAVNYRKWGGRNPGREHAGGDRVMILEDTDGD